MRGGVTAYRKVFSGAGVEAFLTLEGMYVGIGMDETITLGDLFFVTSNSVKVGSYTYDEPGKEDDPRLIAFRTGASRSLLRNHGRFGEDQRAKVPRPHRNSK